MISDKRQELPEFRLAVRHWLQESMPNGWRQKMENASGSDIVKFHRDWMRQRHQVGLAIPHWPSAYGGGDLGLEHQIIIAEEDAKADVPWLSASFYMVSLTHVPATLLAWGTENQRRKYLPPIADGAIWCQGFSEPNSGSDLASLRTKAVRDGNAYVINGQKIWSSQSMHAERCILLARTDFEVRKQLGITYFILDMRAPGVTVRPIRQANGHSEFAEIFLDNVRIPIEDRIGDENQGWTVAQSTLAAERGILAFEGAERHRYSVESFLQMALRDRASWLRDDQLRREFVKLFAEIQSTRRLIRKLLAESHTGAASRSVLPAIVKIIATSLTKSIAEFKVRTQEVSGQTLLKGSSDIATDPMFEYITSFGGAIAAGSNEVLRNIIAERGLGLPR